MAEQRIKKGGKWMDATDGACICIMVHIYGNFTNPMHFVNVLVTCN